MFTGIVQALGILIGSSPTTAGKHLTISLAELANAPITPGDSVCVSGVCLTVVKVANGNASFDIITETLNRSCLGQKHIADRVNLELSLQASTFIGGHFVQGHVDALGTVAAIKSDPENWRITIKVPSDVMPAIVPKGSVAVDGVSMTIAETSVDTFTIAVIPTTLERTTLSALAVGDPVNVETDIIARTVVHYLNGLRTSGGNPASVLTSGVSLQKLKESGFA